MNESAAEVLIIAINALGAGILLFVSQVVQSLMDEMDEIAFQDFAQKFGRVVTSDTVVVTIATVPLLAIAAYWAAYHFSHLWFTAGIALWLIASSITKIANLPIYAFIRDPNNADPAELRKRRRTLGAANSWRAWLTLASVALMACQFSVEGTAIAVAACVVLAPPSVWLARKYFHN